MRNLVVTFFVAGLLAGCALPEQAYYTDREYGVASQDAFDQQIVHIDYIHADKPVEGMSGIHVEPIMTSYHSTFSNSFSSESIDISQTGSN